MFRTIATMFAMLTLAGAATPQFDTDSDGSGPFPNGPHIFLRGDSNGDGRIDTSDPIATLNFLFLGNTDLNQEAADYNDDGSVNMEDAIAALRWMYLGAAGPAGGTQYVRSRQLDHKVAVADKIIGQTWGRGALGAGYEPMNHVLMLSEMNGWFDAKLFGLQPGTTPENLGGGTFDMTWSSGELPDFERAPADLESVGLSSINVRAVSGFLGGPEADGLPVFGYLVAVSSEDEHGEENENMLIFVPLASGQIDEMTAKAQAEETRMTTAPQKSTSYNPIDHCWEDWKADIKIARLLYSGKIKIIEGGTLTAMAACIPAAALCGPIFYLACVWACQAVALQVESWAKSAANDWYEAQVVDAEKAYRNCKKNQ